MSRKRNSRPPKDSSSRPNYGTSVEAADPDTRRSATLAGTHKAGFLREHAGRLLATLIGLALPAIFWFGHQLGQSRERGELELELRAGHEAEAKLRELRETATGLSAQLSIDPRNRPIAWMLREMRGRVEALQRVRLEENQTTKCEFSRKVDDSASPMHFGRPEGLDRIEVRLKCCATRDSDRAKFAEISLKARWAGVEDNPLVEYSITDPQCRLLQMSDETLLALHPIGGPDVVMLVESTTIAQAQVLCALGDWSHGESSGLVSDVATKTRRICMIDEAGVSLPSGPAK
jgi:hypothetical protein